jgi:uncharacterized membrane protein
VFFFCLWGRGWAGIAVWGGYCGDLLTPMWEYILCHAPLEKSMTTLSELSRVFMDLMLTIIEEYSRMIDFRT